DYLGLALWTWHTDSLHMGYWFGVPLANYTSWFVAVVAFTIAVRVGEHQLSVGPLNFKRHCWCAVAVFAGSLLFLLLLEFTLKLAIDWVMCTQPVFKSLPQQTWQFGFLTALLGSSLALVLVKTNFFEHLKSGARFELPAVAPHFFVFLFCLMGLLVAGIYERS